MTPKYMLDYVTEIGWREDARRMPTSKQVGMLLNATQRTPSKWWRGYWQKKHRADEIILKLPAAAASPPS